MTGQRQLGVLGRARRVLQLLRDPRVGHLPRAAVVLAVLYALWPVDLVPELFMPLPGLLDDLTLLWLSLRWLLRSEPEARPAGSPQT